MVQVVQLKLKGQGIKIVGTTVNRVDEILNKIKAHIRKTESPEDIATSIHNVIVGTDVIVEQVFHIIPEHIKIPEEGILGRDYFIDDRCTEIIRSTRNSIHANSQYAIPLNLTAPCVF